MRLNATVRLGLEPDRSFLYHFFGSAFEGAPKYCQVEQEVCVLKTVRSEAEKTDRCYYPMVTRLSTTF